MVHKEVALKIEQFYNDDDLEFRISSKREIQSILQSIADVGSRVALFYGSGQSCILTTLIGVNGHGMWLDVGPFPPENKQILLSQKITFVSVHQHVKIQFVAGNIENDLFENNEAFYLDLPDYLIRLQRRDFFRTSIPATVPIKCIIPVPQENPEHPAIMREVPITDISGGGIGLMCAENEAELLPKSIFPDCQISIPDVGVLTVNIEVRNAYNVTTPNNAVHRHVGCRFYQLNNQTNILLQRYITRLQSESLAKP